MKLAAVVMTALALVLVLVGLGLGSTWRVQTRVDIAAPADVIFPLVADFEKGWSQWAGFAEFDPSATLSYQGTPGTVGHSIQWHGDASGNGRLTLQSVDVTRGIAYRGALESNVDNNEGSLSFVPTADGGTTVVWVDSGTAPPIIGGYLKDLTERALRARCDANLQALKHKAEAQHQVQQAARALQLERAKAAAEAAAAAVGRGDAAPADATRE